MSPTLCCWDEMDSCRTEAQDAVRGLVPGRGWCQAGAGGSVPCFPSFSSAVASSQGPQGEPGPPGQQGNPGAQVRGKLFFYW